MFPIIVPTPVHLFKNAAPYVEPTIVMELLSNYTEMPVDEFVNKAKKKLKDNSGNVGLMESIECIRTLFAFDTCKESRRVSLVNFVLNTNIPGPSWFERVFKGK
jgi:hypothetical protein